MSSGRRAGQRFDAAHRVTTEALIFLGELDPENVGPGIEFATHYEATPVEDVERLLDASPLQPERATFIDLGSGMGRVVLLASRRPFRQIVGVEISPALHEIARENLARFPRADVRCRDVRLVRADAASFPFPRGDVVVYLYNPFRAEVLDAVLDALAPGRNREVVMLYHTPLERERIERRPGFEIFADLGFGTVYRRPAESEGGAAIAELGVPQGVANRIERGLDVAAKCRDDPDAGDGDE